MSSRKSSKQSTASQSLSFHQTLIDEHIDSIQACVVHEKALETDHIQWLLGPGDSNSPRSVGISPAYSQSGGMPALACANGTRVLIINLHSTRPYSDGNISGSGTAPRNIERRKLFEEVLLCNPFVTVYAFDLAPFALSLRLHAHLHVTNAIDIQSALQVADRSVVGAVQVVITEIFLDNITGAFKRILYESNKDKDLTDLVQRAWLSGFIGQYDLGLVKDMFYKAPKVDMKKFSDEELNVLQKMAYDMLRLDILKPLSVTHEIKTRWDHKKEKVVAISQHYSNHMPHSASPVMVAIAHNSSTSYTLSGSTSRTRGRSTLVEVEHNLEGKEITSITSIGKEPPTQAESEHSLAILSILQGTLSLLDNHWMRAIWFPSQPVNWPDSFSPPPDLHNIEIQEHPDAPLNDSQHTAITNMLSPSLDTHLTLVQGPPGTGKTTVIATYVLSAIHARQRGIWLMAQSNPAVKNIAEKLASLDFLNFRLLVSQSFYNEWHEHLYEKIRKNIIVSDRLPKPSDLQKVLKDSQVIICTISMISNPKLQGLKLTEVVPVINAIIDEASQIEVGQYIPLIKSFGNTLQKLCFVGDDKQLPPYGQDNLGNLQSIFELTHLKKSLTFLDTQYRMPPQIGDFISQHVYDSQLKSNPSHAVPSSVISCHFVNVNGFEKAGNDKKSYINKKEIEAVLLLAQHLQDEGKSYRIITPYDAQKTELEHALQDADLNWHNKCFSVDSFQGNEDDIIVISLVRSKTLGFLTSTRRTNVMLTRCRRGMYIVSSKAFLEGKGANSVVGKMAAELGKRPGAWLTHKDLRDGRFE